MPGYRCLNNQSGYCQDPHRQSPYDVADSCSDIGGVFVLQTSSLAGCHLDPQKCGFFVTWKEVCRDIQPIEE
ncbi:hypothetical protein ES705_29886 [subsurface metagenome]